MGKLAEEDGSFLCECQKMYLNRIKHMLQFEIKYVLDTKIRDDEKDAGCQ